ARRAVDVQPGAPPRRRGRADAAGARTRRAAPRRLPGHRRDRAQRAGAASLTGALSGLVYFASSGTRNYSRAEIGAWLASAGFAAIEVHRNERSPWRLLYLAGA